MVLERSQNIELPFCILANEGNAQTSEFVWHPRESKDRASTFYFYIFLIIN